MRIGVAKEIKDNENRVGLTAEGAAELVGAGHDLCVEQGAGLGCGIADADYEGAGATLVDVSSAWNADLVIKVKEPTSAEFSWLGGQIVFTYFHLAGVDVCPDSDNASLREASGRRRCRGGIGGQGVCARHQHIWRPD